MDYLLIFHANLNYGYLSPEQHPFICEASYLKLIDFFNQTQAGAHWTLALTGYTLDTLSRLYPESKSMLKKALAEHCEGAASPYAHSVLPLFPGEHATQALKLTLKSWDTHLGHRPRVGWIPEFAWCRRLPGIYSALGLDHLVVDYDSYVQSREKKRIHKDLWKSVSAIEQMIDLRPDDRDLHFALNSENRGKTVMRTDRLDLLTCRYLQEGGHWDALREQIDRYSQGEGYLTVYAGNAEYLGTTAWYHLPEGGVENTFQPQPDCFERLGRLVDYLGKRGRLLTVTEAALNYGGEALLQIDHGLAWHHGHVSQWEGSPQSKYLNTHCKFLGEKLLRAQEKAGMNQARLEQAWWNLVQAESSDGGYALPLCKPGEYNFKYCLNHLEEAQQIADQLTMDNLPSVNVEKL